MRKMIFVALICSCAHVLLAAENVKRLNIKTGLWQTTTTSTSTGQVGIPPRRQGSAWIAKDDSLMVKFQFDYIMLFSDGENSTTHYEGVVAKK